jgi:hypothetical protein
MDNRSKFASIEFLKAELMKCNDLLLQKDCALASNAVVVANLTSKLEIAESLLNATYEKLQNVSIAEENSRLEMDKVYSIMKKMHDMR